MCQLHGIMNILYVFQKGGYGHQKGVYGYNKRVYGEERSVRGFVLYFGKVVSRAGHPRVGVAGDVGDAREGSRKRERGKGEEEKGKRKRGRGKGEEENGKKERGKGKERRGRGVYA